MDGKAALRPAIVVGAICEMLALVVMGRSDPLQGNWAVGLQLLLVFLLTAGGTWLLIMARAPKRPG